MMKWMDYEWQYNTDTVYFSLRMRHKSRKWEGRKTAARAIYGTKYFSCHHRDKGVNIRLTLADTVSLKFTQREIAAVSRGTSHVTIKQGRQTPRTGLRHPA